MPNGTSSNIRDQLGKPLLGISQTPVLIPVIHAEEEFPWEKDFNRDHRGTGHISALASTQQTFESYGITPLYVMTDPVAKDPVAHDLIGSWANAGKAEIGAHLHPWVVEPYKEKVSNYNSYPGNLDPALEADKLANLTKTIEQRFGKSPLSYLAGRYGLGANTAKTLSQLGYQIDFSPSPSYSFSHQEGPDYKDWCHAPYFNATTPDILHIPHACGYAGLLAKGGGYGPFAKSLKNRFPNLLSSLGSLGLLQHGRVSPEGMPLGFMKQLARGLVSGGASVITLSFHSPTLVPGNTAYVTSPPELDAFLERIDGFCRWFVEDFGGCGTKLATLYQTALSAKDKDA